jgi:hypothetical protein
VKYATIVAFSVDMLCICNTQYIDLLQRACGQERFDWGLSWEVEKELGSQVEMLQNLETYLFSVSWLGEFC